MIRRPPRSTLDRSSAASDVYKRQAMVFPAQALNRSTIAAAMGIDPFCRVDLAQIAGTDCLGGRAVSYTHLRAHETVLDLVCRLLLEKKK